MVNVKETAKRAAVGLIIANPLAALIIIIVGFALLLILGAIGLPIVLGMFTNFLLWGTSLLLVILIRPTTKRLVLLAVLVGLLFWGYDIYVEYTAIQDICNTPLIGGFLCGAWNIITFLPKMFMLGLYIMVSFTMLWILGFIRYLIEG